MNMPAKPSTGQSNSTKAELEATVKELRAALEEAQNIAATFANLKDALEESQRKEASLQEKIADLQSDLQQHKESVNKLEKELDKVAQLKAELAQAKQEALKLAEINEGLSLEIKKLKKEQEGLKGQDYKIVDQTRVRPIQKESEKPVDFATKSWLL
jgi:DNA repair exonuclease SbcCD ATPase subunit